MTRHARSSRRAVRSQLRRRWARAVVVPVAFLASTAMVWQSSHAAFTAKTTMGANSWTGGTVALGNTPATALFSLTGLIPGSFGDACVVTDYTGTVPAQVRLYLKASDLGGTGLAPFLTLQIEQGTGSNSGCSDFVRTTTAYNAVGLTDTTKTFTAFSAAAGNYANGVGGWAATPGSSRTYRFSWQLQDNNAARTLTATAAFTWEAQST